jgi:predicted NBD/HSP70 family sugar kinase
VNQLPEKSQISDDMRKHNRLRILQEFRQTPTLSRTQLAEKTGLSAGTITNVTTQLLAGGILLKAGDTGETTAKHGRPQVQLALNPTRATLVYGSLSYGRLTLCSCDYAGGQKTPVTDTFSTDGITGPELADRIKTAITGLLPDRTPDVVSLGVQGTTTKARDGLLWSPILKDTALDFPHILSQSAGTTVVVENDCATIVRALNQRQAGQTATFAAVLMSYGIGMGLQIDGKPFSGSTSSATEFGHLPYRPGGAQCRCGKKGCIEAYASDYAIWRAATGGDPAGIPDRVITREMIQAVMERAKAGDGPDRAALQEAARALGVGLATVFTLLDPFPVVFIGPGSSLVSLLEDDLRQSLRENFRFDKRPRLSFQTEADETALTEQGAQIAANQVLDRQAAYAENP